MRKETEDFIKEVQKSFPNENVNIENVNDFYIVLCDKNNCANCKGLDKCQNSNQGFWLIYFLDFFLKSRLQEQDVQRRPTSFYTHICNPWVSLLGVSTFILISTVLET